MITHETTKKIVHILCTHATDNWLFCNCTSLHENKNKKPDNKALYCILQQQYFLLLLSQVHITDITFGLDMICVRTYVYMYVIHSLPRDSLSLLSILYVMYLSVCLFGHCRLQQYISVCLLVCEKPMKGLKFVACYVA